MKRVLHTTLVIAAGGAAMLLLDAVAKRRGGGRRRVTQALLARLRPAPVADDTVETRVRNKLARTATHPDTITVSIEHGCADLRGAVPTRERSRIVRAIATVRGVDSVLDLMTEPPAASVPPAALAGRVVASASAAPVHSRRVAPWWLRRAEWPAAVRVVAVGGGLGLTMAGLRSGGLVAVPAATLGLLLITRGVTATAPTSGESREPHAAF